MVSYFDTSLLFNLYVPEATSSVDVVSLVALTQDLTDFYEVRSPAWAKVFETFEKVSALVTVSEGTRGMDLMHLAIAVEENVDSFSSADTRQRNTAKILALTILE